MKLQIDRTDVEALIERFPDRAPLAEQLRFGDLAEVAFGEFETVELDDLVGLYRAAGPRLQARAAQIVTLRRALTDGGARFTAQDLESLPPEIARYLMADAIHGWMFGVSIANLPLPYVVTGIDYTPPSSEETGRVFMELKANAKGGHNIGDRAPLGGRHRWQGRRRNFRDEGISEGDARARQRP